MDARVAGKQQPALLAHAALHATGAGQGLAQRGGVGHGHAHVVAGPGRGAVGAVVVDEFGAAVCKLAQLQAAVQHAEEGVVLHDELGCTAGHLLGAGQERLYAVDAGLDLDVARHGVSSLFGGNLPQRLLEHLGRLAS